MHQSKAQRKKKEVVALREPDDQHRCPLLNRTIFWGDCVEVQEIRADSMDMELFGEEFDINDANCICEKCRWYFAADP